MRSDKQRSNIVTATRVDQRPNITRSTMYNPLMFLDGALEETLGFYLEFSKTKTMNPNIS